MNNSKTIIITGGAFNGKSSVALRLAPQLNLSGVISIDSVRNTYKILNPQKEYFSSSIYMLSENLIHEKVNDVSSIVKKMIDIYITRGESILFEGIHLSENLFRWASKKGVCGICLINERPLSERIILKSKTRSKLRLTGTVANTNYLGEISTDNVNKSMYMKYENKILKHQKTLIDRSKKHGFKLIKFNDLETATRDSLNWIESWYKK